MNVNVTWRPDRSPPPSPHQVLVRLVVQRFVARGDLHDVVTAAEVAGLEADLANEDGEHFARLAFAPGVARPVVRPGL